MIVDKLDSVPQVPQDYGNHVIYGSGAAIVLAALLNWHIAFAIVLVIAAGKKVFDYLNEHETFGMCVGKILATVILPLAIVLHLFPKVV